MNKPIQLLSLLPVLAMSLASAHASDTSEDAWYFSPMLSYIKADNDRQADDDFGLHLGLGTQLSDNWNIEVSATMDKLDFESVAGDYNQKGLIVDGLYVFDRTTELQTFALIGAGIMNTDTGTGDSTNPMVNVGLGVMQQITDAGMKFRADVRYRMDMDDESVATEDNFNDLVLNLGLVIPLGDSNKARPGKTATKVLANKDSDNDGVTDGHDNCPATAAGARVDAKGCEIIPQKTGVDTRPDGDADADGVANSKDRCPQTVSNVNVDVHGCELQQSFVLKGVNFITGSNRLKQEAKTVLDDVSETLKKNSKLKVEVAGYTDDRGKADFNLKLSQQRAQAVRTYLVSAGVDAEQLSSRGYGEADPIANNNTSQGRAINRRVELHILQ